MNLYRNGKIFISIFLLLLSALFLIINVHISSNFYTNFTEQVPVKYKAKIVSEINDLIFSPAQNAIVKIKLVNEGSEVWDSSKPEPVKISYNILNSDMKDIKSNYEDIVIPGEVYYYYFVDIDIPITAPNKKGTYYIEFNLKKGNKVVYVLDEKIKMEVR
ncbi:hypothetical protein [Thermoanaerobacter uzonensis]|uniref:hypothetical protein n=1 Tax=Thermoanaerobacter uzonensis TaxID=447593 RepID=UPI003D769D3E